MFSTKYFIIIYTFIIYFKKIPPSISVLSIFVLERLSNSKYSRNFILKGGMLISSMMGIMERTTMDMDTTVNGINMDEDEISNIIKEILLIDVGDGIRFELKS